MPARRRSARGLRGFLADAAREHERVQSIERSGKGAGFAQRQRLPAAAVPRDERFACVNRAFLEKLVEQLFTGRSVRARRPGQDAIQIEQTAS